MTRQVQTQKDNIDIYFKRRNKYEAENAYGNVDCTHEMPLDDLRTFQRSVGVRLFWMCVNITLRLAMSIALSNDTNQLHLITSQSRVLRCTRLCGLLFFIKVFVTKNNIGLYSSKVNDVKRFSLEFLSHLESS